MRTKKRSLWFHGRVALFLGAQAISSQASVPAADQSLSDADQRKHQIVYITNHGNSANQSKGSVTICRLFHHHLKDCQDSGAGEVFNTPSDIVITHRNHQKNFAYIANNQAASISVCEINPSDSSLGNCTEQNKGFPSAAGLSLNPQGNHLYITSNQFYSTVYACSLSPENGQLESCQQTGSDFHNPTTIAIDPTGNFALVGNFDDTIAAGRRLQSCAINQKTGQLTQCRWAGSGAFYPSHISFSQNGQKVYIAGYYTDSVNVCSFDAKTGLIQDCKSSGAAGVALPTSVAFSRDQALITTGKTSLQICRRDTDSGFMSDCADAGATNLNAPSAIAVR